MTEKINILFKFSKNQLDYFVSKYKKGEFEKFIVKLDDEKFDRLTSGIKQEIKNGDMSIDKNNDIEEMWVLLEDERSKRPSRRLDQNENYLNTTEINKGNKILKFISYHDFITQEFEEPKWIIENLIPENGLCAVAGSPESFKSFFVDYMAVKVAKGEDILGKFKVSKTAVLVIDLENISSWIHKRLTQLCSDTDLPFYIFDKESTSIDLLDDIIFSQLIGFIKKHNIGLVIIDTLRLIHFKEENSSTDLRPVIDRLKEISKIAAVLFIHHHRKTDKFSRGKSTGEDMMGSIFIRGSVDYQLTLTNLGRKEEGSNNIKVVQTKARYTKAIKPFEMALEQSGDLLVFTYKGEAVEEKLKKEEAKNFILNLLEKEDIKRPDLIDQVIASEICAARTVEEALKELKKENKIQHTSSKPHIYSLVTDNQNNITQTATLI